MCSIASFPQFIINSKVHKTGLTTFRYLDQKYGMNVLQKILSLLKSIDDMIREHLCIQKGQKISNPILITQDRYYNFNHSLFQSGQAIYSLRPSTLAQ